MVQPVDQMPGPVMGEREGDLDGDVVQQVVVAVGQQPRVPNLCHSETR